MTAPDRYAFLLGHDAIDSWPAPSRVFAKAWEARTELHRALDAQPGAVGIVARWDAPTEAWMAVTIRQETARHWWERVAS